MPEYSIVLDVWEGNLEMNEAAFKAGNIAGLIIRINSMSGGHHLDSAFTKQWTESQDFNPAPYFVYNPWVTGKINFDWLRANAPDCPTVFIDTEVRMPGLSPITYGAEYGVFIKLCQAKWHTVIYGGRGFLDMLEPWPKIEYWWAQWPWPLYPTALTPVTTVTWLELHGYFDKLTWPPANASYCPGTTRLWQCSGDRFIVPGVTRKIDINYFPGTFQNYRTWLGYDDVVVPPTLTIEERVTNLETVAISKGWDIVPTP